MHRVKKFENGFEYIEVSNAAASAKIALQGAHIFEYVKRGKTSLLWLSERSLFESGTAIRGGIPLCWPRFGSLDASMPQHGFARISLFKLLSVKELDEFSTELHLELQDTKESREIWSHHFVLDVKIVVSQTLKISMKTKNLDEKDFFLTQAFHTYFAVSYIENVRIEGLKNCYYIDTLHDEKCKQREDIVIDSEIDRVYMDTDESITLVDRDKKITLKTEGSASTVIWNPWREKCARMSHMSREAYKEFVCIESANAFDDFILLKSKKSHTLELTISF